MPSAPAFSIVIVTYGKRAVTEACLASLEAAFGARIGEDVELVLVDNASPDDTVGLLDTWRDRATVIGLERNLNFSGGNNVGARAARGEVLVLLNNDTEVPAGALERLVEQALEPGVGIVGCRLLYPEGSLQHGGVGWWRAVDGNVRPFHLFRHEAGDLPAACATLDCDVVTGACVAIRRSLFASLGGLDEAFANGFEDVDLCVRARVAGHRVVYRGDVAVVHAEGATRSRRYDDSRNELLFISRYRDLTHEDDERFGAQFDAAGPHFNLALHPGDAPEGSSVSVEGEVTGLAPEAAEARALLGALTEGGLAPATRDWQRTTMLPRLDQREWAPVNEARARPKRRDALIIQAPVGRLGAIEVHPRAILRLAAPPAIDVSGAAAIWAASHALAAELIEAGADPERVGVLAPLIPEVAVGAGGGGILVALPAHDLDRCASLLRAVAQVPGQPRIRLVPTVATEPVAKLAGRLLPAGELLAPVASEQRFAALAARCDVALCADPRDPFERRALIAAAAGAAAVHLPGGAAAEILGDDLAFDGSPGALVNALAQGSQRNARARRVAAACGLTAAVPRLGALLQAARAPRTDAALALP